jgi:Putative lumazine-binding
MTEEAGVRAAVLDYVEGWFDGNAERMERALHPDLVKRCRGLEGHRSSSTTGRSRPAPG